MPTPAMNATHTSNPITRSRRGSMFVLWGSSLLAACAHSGAPAQTSAPRPQVSGEVASAPARSAPPPSPEAREPAHDESGAATAAAPRTRIEDYMEDHFVI